MFAFGMTIVGEYINLKKIFIATIISAFSSMLFRTLAPFGLHSILGISILFLLSWKLLNLTPLKAIISSLFSFMVLALLDTMIVPIILKAENLTLVELWKDNYKRIIYGYPPLIVYGLITWFLYSKKIFLIRGSRVGNDYDYDYKYNKPRLLLALIILFQGLLLFVIDEHLLYLGKYSLLILLLCIIFFIFSILFIFLYGSKRSNTKIRRDF